MGQPSVLGLRSLRMMLVSLWEALDKAWYLVPRDFLKGEAGNIVFIKGSERVGLERQ